MSVIEKEVCEVCGECDESVRFYEKSGQIWCESCAEQVPCKGCGCWYFETESGYCDDCDGATVRFPSPAELNKLIDEGRLTKEMIMGYREIFTKLAAEVKQEHLNYCGEPGSLNYLMGIPLSSGIKITDEVPDEEEFSRYL